MTTAQFAKLHKVNKRTLHYYDYIGLFSPKYKGDNGYRYYVSSQSMDFEFIKMLKELNMSIEEIRELISDCNEDRFLNIAVTKQKEIDIAIYKLQQTKAVLERKQKQLLLSNQVSDMQIDIIPCKKEYLMTTPFSFENEEITEIYEHLQEVWEPEQCRMGIGSYISLDNAEKGLFDNYSGVFTPVFKKKTSNNIMVKPKGNYLAGYLRGTWGKLPELYKALFQYAKVHKLSLSGYAYEITLNDFSVASIEDYVTQVTIKIDD